MAKIELRNVCKRYTEGSYAVKNFNLDIEDKDFVVFVGPSGCGKSTTLRMVAGLEEISDGELWIDDKYANYLEPGERELSMVFQNYALYPYMNVYKNMAFGLKMHGFDKAEIDKRVKSTAKMLGIDHLLDRMPKALSGGQKQRVAMGSVIVRQPKLYLMDEPLSNLDTKLRSQMRVELSKIHKELGATVIYVTHDQVEAMTLGNKIVVLKDGIIQQVSSPKELYENPVNLFVANFIGTPAMNLMDVRICVVKGKVMFDFGSQMIEVEKHMARRLTEEGYLNKEMVLGIRPEHVSIDTKGCLETNLTAEVMFVEGLGHENILHVSLNGQKMSVKTEAQCNKKERDKCPIVINQDFIKLFDKFTEENIFFRKEIV